MLDQVFKEIDNSGKHLPMLFFSMERILAQTKCFLKIGNRWEYVNGLLLNVIYGGRIDNNFDLRILRSYLAQYFNDDVLGKDRSAINDEISVPLSKNLRVFLKLPCLQSIFVYSYFFLIII